MLRTVANGEHLRFILSGLIMRYGLRNRTAAYDNAGGCFHLFSKYVFNKSDLIMTSYIFRRNEPEPKPALLL